MAFICLPQKIWIILKVHIRQQFLTIVFLTGITSLSFPPCMAQTLTEKSAEEFIDKLIHTPDQLKTILKRKNLLETERLGITYKGVENKFLISYEPNRYQKEMIIEGKLDYQYNVSSVSSDFSKITLLLDNEPETAKDFYFDKDSLISPIEFFTGEWNQIESKYFRIYSESTELLNEFSIDKLDQFVEETIKILDINKDNDKLLADKKIIYILCESEESVKKITGYSSRGQYNLAYDAIVSTYNAHLHEIAHLLVNYKLKENNLFTHPFLQEGIAVALGGRGGLAKEPLFSFAEFALLNNFIDQKQLFDIDSFSGIDASITYPVSGYLLYLYNKNFDTSEFLKLYSEFGSDTREKIPKIPSSLFSFQRTAADTFEYIEFIGKENIPDDLRLIANDGENQISSNEEWYYFSLSDTVLIASDIPVENFKSNKFSEIFPERPYPDVQYLISVNEAEIAIYDLYTNDLLTNYIASFHENPTPIPFIENRVYFRIRKEFFNSSLIRLE